MRLHWVTEFEPIANSFGYSVHNAKSREAAVRAGARLDDSADVAVHACPAHNFQPIAGKLNLIYLAWEAAQIPDAYRGMLAAADAICVTASFLVEPFRRMFPGLSVHLVHDGIDGDEFPFLDRMAAKYRPNFRPAYQGGRPFRFLWVGAPNARKGVFSVLEAWRAFTEGPGVERLANSVELYIKTSLPIDAKNRQGVVRKGNVIIDDRRVSVRDLCGIYHRSHCFVFPSLGEGFGLTAAEAAATGLPVIYTPATALLDLFPPDAGDAYPVEFTWQPQTWTWDQMSVEAQVSVADTTDLARQMLLVSRNHIEAFARGRRAAQRVRRDFSWDACGKTLLRVARSLKEEPHVGNRSYSRAS